MYKILYSPPPLLYVLPPELLRRLFLCHIPLTAIKLKGGGKSPKKKP